MLDSESGAFADVTADLNNELLEGVFSFKRLASGKRIMSFDAITVKRFAILFAFCHNESWCVRLGLISTTKNGFLGFKITKTLYQDNGKFAVPPPWNGNTALVFGIQSGRNDIDMRIRVFTERMYECYISYHYARDEINLSDELLPSNARKRSYASHLYSVNSTPVATLREQRHVIDESALVQRAEGNNQADPNEGNDDDEGAVAMQNSPPVASPEVNNESDAADEFNSCQFWKVSSFLFLKKSCS